MRPRNQADYSVEDWNRQYETGDYAKKWDIGGPSPDLVATVSVLGLRSGTALDLGCGAGAESIYLAARGLKVIGVDVSLAALAIARTRSREAGVKVQLCAASSVALPVASASIDFANDRGCLHSLGLADWEQYANEMARVLRPGALAVIRGCRDESHPAFTGLTQKRLATTFGDGRFLVRAAAAISLCASHGHIPAAFALLERRA